MLSAALFVVLAVGNFSDFSDGWGKIENILITALRVPHEWAGAVAVLFLLLCIAIVLLARLLLGKDAAAAVEAGDANPTPADIRRSYLDLLERDLTERLKASIHGAVMLNLEFSEREKATVPWHFRASSPDKAERRFETVDEALAAFQGRMLLLGSPGAGKSTTILQIALRMIEKARHGDGPLPIHASLAHFQGLIPDGQYPSRRRSLAPGRAGAEEDKRSAFPIRLAEKVATMSVDGLAPDVVLGWIRNREAAFLLDGLDEVEDEQRAALVKWINETLLKAYPGAPAVISSRIVEYQGLEHSEATKLALDGAVTLHPLEPEQIERYLREAGAEAVSKVLRDDEALNELAKTPLLLDMITLAYRGRASIVISSSASIALRRRQLIDDFVDRMMQREESRRAGIQWDPFSDKIWRTTYSRDQMNRYLGRLAVAMSERMQTYIPAHGGVAQLYLEPLRSSSGRLWQTRHTAAAALAFALALLLGVAMPARYGWQPAPLLGALIAFPLAWGFWAGLRGSDIDYQFALAEARSIPARVATALAVTVGFAAALGPSLFAAMLSRISHGAIRGTDALIVAAANLLALLDKDRRAQTVTALGTIALLAAALAPNVRLPGYAWDALSLSLLLASVIIATKQEAMNDPHEGPVQIPAVFFGVTAIALLVGGAAYGFALLGPKTFTVLQMTALAIGIGASFFTIGATAAVAIALISAFLGRDAGCIALPYAFAAAMLMAGSEDTTLQKLQKRRLRRLYEAANVSLLCLPAHWFLVAKRQIPPRAKRLFDYAAACFVMRKDDGKYSFMHLLLRDHFAVRELAPALEGRTTAARIATIEKLANQGEASIGLLKELFDDPEPQIRAAAVRAIMSIPSPQIGKIALDVLDRSPDPGMRLPAVAATHFANPEEANAVVEKALKDPDALVRVEGVRRMNRLGKGQQLQEALSDPDDRVVRAVLLLVDQPDEQFFTAAKPICDNARLSRIVKDMLTDEDDSARFAGGRAARVFMLEDLADSLLAALLDPKYRVRESALRALLLFPLRAAVPSALRAYAAGAEDESLRLSAIDFLGQLTVDLRAAGLPEDVADGFAQTMRKAVQDPDWRVRRAGAHSTSWMRSPLLIEVLRLSLNDKFAEVRSAGFWLLREAATARADLRTELDQFQPALLKGLRSSRTVGSAALAAAALRPAELLVRLRSELSRPRSRLQLGALLVSGLLRDTGSVAAISRLLVRVNGVPGEVRERLLFFAEVVDLAPGPLRGEAMRALWRIGSDEALALLEAYALSDRSWARRAAIEVALGERGSAILDRFLAQVESEDASAKAIAQQIAFKRMLSRDPDDGAAVLEELGATRPVLAKILEDARAKARY